MNLTTKDATQEPTTPVARLVKDYTEQEKSALTQIYEATLNSVKEGEVVTGKVVGISNRDFIIDVGLKSDGLVPINEFRDLPDLKPGDEVEVYIEEQEDAKGQLVLSHKKARLVRIWEKIQAAAENTEAIEGLVKRRTKGGLVVDIYGIEAFLPGSQVDVKPARDFDSYVGKKIDVAVVKINHANENVVVSHKALIEKSLEGQRSEIISTLEKGQILKGVVKNITNFGAFIDLGILDGLLHVTDIVWGRITHPEEVLTLGQTVEVVVIDFEEERRRVSLGMKQLTPHPWESLPDTIKLGTKVQGKVTKTTDYGVFLEIIPNVEGLIHISEISWSQYPRNISDWIQVGDELEAIVISLNHEEKKIALSVKRLTEDPWGNTDLAEKYALGTKHQVTVKAMTRFSVFVELQEGIDGLLRVADLSWTQKINHPSELLKVGEIVETVVLEFNQENKKLVLGHKQLRENPWDTCEETFRVGSVHKGKIIKKIEKGALVLFQQGLEGFIPNRHLAKENGQEAQVDEELDLKVIEFSKENKRIVLSHNTAFSRDKEHSHQSSYSKSDTKAESPTLGDIKSLSSLGEETKEEIAHTE